MSQQVTTKQPPYNKSDTLKMFLYSIYIFLWASKLHILFKKFAAL